MTAREIFRSVLDGDFRREVRRDRRPVADAPMFRYWLDLGDVQRHTTSRATALIYRSSGYPLVKIEVIA